LIHFSKSFHLCSPVTKLNLEPIYSNNRILSSDGCLK
jgi:hypothetical protein